MTTVPTSPTPAAPSDPTLVQPVVTASSASAARRAEAPPPSRPPRRRGFVAAAIVVVLALGAAAVLTRRSTTAAPATGKAAAATTTAPVVVKDLVVSETYDGQLGYGTATSIAAARAGVVTGVPAVGTIVGPGQTLFQINLQPTVFLTGAVPAFRTMSVGVTDGADVNQLEQALVNLGFGDGVTVDNTYTDATAAAVKAWETSLGRTSPDGTVDLGDVAFAPDPVRISAITSKVGTQVQPTTAVLDASPTAKVITMNLTADALTRVKSGSKVQVTLPDKKKTTGTVAAIGQETTSSSTGAGQAQGGNAQAARTTPVTVTIDDADLAKAFESGTVSVVAERSRTNRATAVPVTALLALAEGGYAVQVVDDAQPKGYRLVGVTTGAYADNFVQVTGDGIRAGVSVVVPR